MKIYILQAIKDYSGKNLTSKETTLVDGTPVVSEVDFTVRNAFENAINSLATDPTTKQPEVLTAEVRNKIYQINLKLYANNEPDFTVTELAFIKERADIGYANNPLVYGRIAELVETGKQSETVNYEEEAKPEVAA